MNHFEIPLDIEDVKIERVEFKENGEIIIVVTSTVEGTYCHRCGQKITDSYGHDREIRLRHLSMAQYGFRTVEDGSSQRRTGATLDGL